MLLDHLEVRKKGEQWRNSTTKGTLSRRKLAEVCSHLEMVEQKLPRQEVDITMTMKQPIKSKVGGGGGVTDR